MNSQAMAAISAMCSAYPQQSEINAKAYLAMMERALTGLRDDAIIETVKAFNAGTLDGISTRFAPAPAEFAVHVRRISSQKDAADRARARPALPAPSSHGIPPFMVRQEKLREAMRQGGRELLASGIGHQEWIGISKRGVIPATKGKQDIPLTPGCTWTATGEIWGPAQSQGINQ